MDKDTNLFSLHFDHVHLPFQCETGTHNKLKILVINSIVEIRIVKFCLLTTAIDFN